MADDSVVLLFSMSQCLQLSSFPGINVNYKNKLIKVVFDARSPFFYPFLTFMLP